MFRPRGQEVGWGWWQRRWMAMLSECRRCYAPCAMAAIYILIRSGDIMIAICTFTLKCATFSSCCTTLTANIGRARHSETRINLVTLYTHTHAYACKRTRRKIQVAHSENDSSCCYVCVWRDAIVNRRRRLAPLKYMTLIVGK